MRRMREAVGPGELVKCSLPWEGGWRGPAGPPVAAVSAERVGVKGFLLTYIILISSEMSFCVTYVKNNKVKQCCFLVCFIKMFCARGNTSLGLM